MQGFNMGRYVPPELAGVASFNQASGKKATSRNIDGSQTVRFECPFAIWCITCQPETIIGQGVRFNAHKKQAGKYLSTPIWSFKFKHTVCGGWIEVRTDPKNTDYVVTEGGRRRDYGEGKVDFEAEGVAVQVETASGIEDALGRVEKKAVDKKAADVQAIRVEELRKRAERDWADPYEMNKKIRKEFRVGRRARDNDKRTGKVLQEKFGLGFDLMPATKRDAERAKLVDFGGGGRENAVKKTLFKKDNVVGKPFEGNAFTIGKSALQSNLQGNTRLKNDPFIHAREEPKPRKEELMLGEKIRQIMPADSNVVPTLVDYDSD